MSSTLNNIIIFTTGAAIGSVVTWKLLKDRYKQIVDEEIESMDAYYRRRYGVDDSRINSSDEDNQIDMQEYTSTLNDRGYTNYSDANKPENKEAVDMSKPKPYVISPDEFGEISEYETKTLYYHADKVLTDDMNNIVEDVDSIVGLDSLNHFGEYEDDSVFVRNDEHESDYEILFDPSNYSDIANDYPHQAEV